MDIMEIKRKLEVIEAATVSVKASSHLQAAPCVLLSPEDLIDRGIDPSGMTQEQFNDLASEIGEHTMDSWWASIDNIAASPEDFAHTGIKVFASKREMDTPDGQMYEKGHVTFAEDVTFISRWDGGEEIRTEAKLDTETGEIFDVATVDVDGLDCLEDEVIEDSDGHMTEVCSTCHSYIMKTAVIDTDGTNLESTSICSDPYCDSND